MSERPRVLVTGARGFIGRCCLAPLRSRGYEVHAVRRAGPVGALPGPPEVRWHAADLTDPSATTTLLEEVRPASLLHLAWFAEHGAFWRSPENLRWVGASLHLAGELARVGGRRLLVVGSCAEYQPAPLCDERATPLEPSSVYGACKDALRRCLEAAAPELGVGVAWARVFFPFGPHDQPNRVVPYVIRRLLEGRPADCSDGTQVRDLLYVEDVGDALAAALDSEVTGALNVASGRGSALRDVLRELAGSLGRPELLRLGVRPQGPHDPPAWVADVRRLREEVGWRPNRSLSDGLRATVEWHRARVEAAASR